jgi:hypothetical protein
MNPARLDEVAGSDSRPSPRLEGAVLCLLLGCAAAVRLHGLATFAFWEDELYSIHETAELFWSRYSEGIAARPLYFVLMNGVTSVLPKTPLGMRIPAVLFGLASIVVAWLVARRLAGPWAGMLTVAVLSLAPGHIFISTIHRYWSLVFLEGLAFAALAVPALARDDPRGYRRALLALLLGVATHPVFLVVVAAVGLGSCVEVGPAQWRWPSRLAWRWLWLPGLAVVAAFYSFVTFLQGIGQVTQIDAGAPGLVQRLRILPAVVVGLTPVVAAGAVVGGIFMLLARGREEKCWGSVLLVGAPAAAAMLLFASGYTIVYWYYLSALLPVVFVGFSGLASSLRTPTALKSAFVLLVLTLAGMAPSAVSQMVDGGRFDFRPAFHAIGTLHPDLPLVMTQTIQAAHYAPALSTIELPEDGSTSVLESLRSAGRPFWLILTERRYGISFDPRGDRLAFALTHCAPAGEYGRHRLDYELFRVRLYLCGQSGDPR